MFLFWLVVILAVSAIAFFFGGWELIFLWWDETRDMTSLVITSAIDASNCNRSVYVFLG